MSSAIHSLNFTFLLVYDPRPVRMGALAERYFSDDPNTRLTKLRQFGELLAQQVAARSGAFISNEASQADLLRRLKAERLLNCLRSAWPSRVFNGLRRWSVWNWRRMRIGCV